MGAPKILCNLIKLPRKNNNMSNKRTLKLDEEVTKCASQRKCWSVLQWIQIVSITSAWAQVKVRGTKRKQRPLYSIHGEGQDVDLLSTRCSSEHIWWRKVGHIDSPDSVMHLNPYILTVAILQHVWIVILEFLNKHGSNLTQKIIYVQKYVSAA